VSHAGSTPDPRLVGEPAQILNTRSRSSGLRGRRKRSAHPRLREGPFARQVVEPTTGRLARSWQCSPRRRSTRVTWWGWPWRRLPKHTSGIAALGE